MRGAQTVNFGMTTSSGTAGARRHVTWRLVIAALAALLLLAACGGADEPADTADAPADAPAATDEPAGGATADAGDAGATEGDTAAADLPTVRYTQAGTSLSFANLLYAQSEQLFEAEGLTMDYQPFPPSSGDMITIMLAGDADVAFGAPSAMYAAVNQGRDLKNYASTQIGPAVGIALHNDVVAELEAEGVTVDSPIEDRIAALQGRSLAGVGAGASLHSLAQSALSFGNLDPEADVTLLPVPDHAEAANAAREGQADGFYAAVPALLTAETDGWGTTWVSFVDVPEIGTMPWIEFTSSTAFAEENPQVMEAMLRAISKANDAFENDPDHVREVLKENWFADTEENLFNASFELVRPTFTQGMFPTEDGLETQLELANVAAEVPIDLSFEEVYDTSVLERLDLE